jgi:hypothetical protein
LASERILLLAISDFSGKIRRLGIERTSEKVRGSALRIRYLEDCESFSISVPDAELNPLIFSTETGSSMLGSEDTFMTGVENSAGGAISMMMSSPFDSSITVLFAPTGRESVRNLSLVES